MLIIGVNKRINIDIKKRSNFLEKIGSFALIISFMLFICSTFPKPLKNFEKNELNEIKFHENGQRYLEDEFDNFMILYYEEDCYYYGGFKNEFRNDIRFIINRENNNNLTSEEELIIHKNFGIEIHFNQKVINLSRFFDASVDINMEYLVSIDLSYFDASSLTDMSSFFYNAISLESINFSNFNTELVTNMKEMFYGCYSLEILD